MSLTKVTYSMIENASISVTDYGADPTGVNDSTAAIQAAINYAITQEKTISIPFVGVFFKIPAVTFPFGTYKVSSAITLGRASILIGNNAIIDLQSYSGASAAFEAVNSASSYTFSGLTFYGGSYAVNLHNVACFLVAKFSDCNFYSQTTKALRVWSDTSCAELELTRCSFNGAAPIFGEFSADLTVMSACSTYALPCAVNNSASFLIQSRQANILDCMFAAGDKDTATQRAWLSFQFAANVNISGSSFGGESGRRTAINVIGTTENITFTSVYGNAAADTPGQLSGTHITFVRLFGDYVSNITFDNCLGNANGALIDFATGATPTHTIDSITLNNVAPQQTPATFVNVVNTQSGFVKRANLLPINLRTAGRRAVLSDAVFPITAANQVEMRFDVLADYEVNSITFHTSTNTYMFEITGSVSLGGGGSNGILTGIVSWANGVANTQLYTDVWLNHLDQRFGSVATVQAIFSTTGLATQPVATSVTTSGGITYYNVKNIVLRVTLGGGNDWLYAYGKLRPLFNTVSY